MRCEQGIHQSKGHKKTHNHNKQQGKKGLGPPYRLAIPLPLGERERCWSAGEGETQCHLKPVMDEMHPTQPVMQRRTT
jgi:hypothetical protein